MPAGASARGRVSARERQREGARDAWTLTACQPHASMCSLWEARTASPFRQGWRRYPNPVSRGLRMTADVVGHG